DRLRRERCVWSDAVVQPAPPCLLELGCERRSGGRLHRAGPSRCSLWRRPFRPAIAGLKAPRYIHRAAPAGLYRPVLADDVVARSLGSVAHRGEQLVRGPATVQRRDERLNDRKGTVVPSGITPCFEKVRFGYVPM